MCRLALSRAHSLDFEYVVTALLLPTSLAELPDTNRGRYPPFRGRTSGAAARRAPRQARHEEVALVHGRGRPGAT